MAAIAFFLFCGRNFGGMERRYSRLARFLSDANNDVALICTCDARDGMSDLGIDIPSDRLILIDFPGRFFERKWLKKINRIYGLLRAFFIMAIGGYRQVHIIANPGWLVCLYARLKRFLPQFSFSVVDSLLHFEPSSVRVAVRGACAVDCLSEAIGEYVRMQCSSQEDMEKVFVSPCSFTDFSQVRLSKERDIDIVMMARFVPGKGYDLLEQAVRHIRTKLNMHICGFGPCPPNIPCAQVYKSDNPSGVFSRAKIFLSLQSVENYPSQSLLEAMASGCAIIATDVGETRRILDESCAVLIDACPIQLAGAVENLINDPSKCQKLGLSAKRRVEECHTIQRFSDYFMINIIKSD